MCVFILSLACQTRISIHIRLLGKTSPRLRLCSSSSVNFKEPEAVRALTCTLLKEDFGLSIQIPLERLIPTVPLRLNYIHWVEDLIDGQKQPRRGIDIGTAAPASCVIQHELPQQALMFFLFCFYK